MVRSGIQWTEIPREAHAANMEKMKASPEGFTIIKQGIAFHSGMPSQFPGATSTVKCNRGRFARTSGVLTERGLKYTIDCVQAMKEALGDEVGLALDCGPGLTVPDAIRLAQAVEPLNVMWLEDMITGDYVPYVLADSLPRRNAEHIDTNPHRRANLPPTETSKT